MELEWVPASSTVRRCGGCCCLALMVPPLLNVFHNGIAHPDDGLDARISNGFYVQPHGDVSTGSIGTGIIQIHSTHNRELCFCVALERFVKRNRILKGTSISGLTRYAGCDDGYGPTDPCPIG